MRAVRRPGHGGDGMDPWRSIVQELAKAIPDLEMAVLAPARDEVRHGMPRDAKDDSVVGLPLEGLVFRPENIPDVIVITLVLHTHTDNNFRSFAFTTRYVRVKITQSRI